MVNKNLLCRGGLSALCVLLWVSWAGAQTQAPVREISRLAGEVYRFRNNNHYSVFAVTPDGIIATDPINADAAKWLKASVIFSWLPMSPNMSSCQAASTVWRIASDAWPRRAAGTSLM